MIKNVKKIMRGLCCLIFCTAVAVGMPQIARATEVTKLTSSIGWLNYEEALKEYEKIPCYDNEMSIYNEVTNDIFEQGTGTYCYNCLNENQKKLYDSLEISFKKFNNNENASFFKIPNYKYYTPFKIEINDNDINERQIYDTWYAFEADHPWLFWVLTCITIPNPKGSGSYVMPLIEEEYNDIETKKATDKIIKNGIQEYINAVTGVNDTYEKVRIIHDKIIDKVNYAYKSDGKTPNYEAVWARSIVGALDNIHNTVICGGYSKTFSFILNILNISNVCITGRADGGAHAWNAVSFDNGNTYYYVDTTWDDYERIYYYVDTIVDGYKKTNDVVKKSKMENTYIYFAMPKDKFEMSHKPNEDTFDFDWKHNMPKLGNDMSKTYFKKYSAYATNDMISDTTSAKKFLTSAKKLAPNENYQMILEDKAFKLVTKALGIYFYSSICIKEYGMNLFTIPSDKTQTSVAETTPVTNPSNFDELSPIQKNKLLLEQIEVAENMSINIGKSKKVKLTLPDDVTVVKKFSGKDGEVQVNYYTSDTGVATINKKGKIKAKKKGSVDITTVVTFENKMSKAFSTKVKVKKNKKAIKSAKESSI